MQTRVLGVYNRAVFTRYVFVLLLPVFFLAGWYVNSYTSKNNLSFTQTQNANSSLKAPDKPLERYTINNLTDITFSSGQVNIHEVIKEDESFTSHKFTFMFEPALDGKQKTVSGQINIPNTGTRHPVVLMLRGFVNQEIYTTGMGTKNASEYFANEGFITIAPDFLGYADSDKEAENIFETRFQSYTTLLSLIKVLPSIQKWDGNNIFIWAHSNGGQIALTSLAITGAKYPTTLWAPVTKPFPYSILYFTDEAADRGRLIRSELAKFEAIYDVEEYSFDDYLDRINAPIMLHQGTADTAVPVSWSTSITKKLSQAGVEITYYTYPGSDHNLRPAWDSVIARDLEFFKKHLR